jgi:hypothetical protein
MLVGNLMLFLMVFVVVKVLELQLKIAFTPLGENVLLLVIVVFVQDILLLVMMDVLQLLVNIVTKLLALAYIPHGLNVMPNVTTECNSELYFLDQELNVMLIGMLAKELALIWIVNVNSAHGLNVLNGVEEVLK